MCGIIAVVGVADAARVIIDGLRRLEYRGYDSAGLAVHTRDGLVIERAIGGVDRLEARGAPAFATTGIGHTRWATHGPPTETNAHPHADCRGLLAVVHNGVIENHLELRERLESDGHVFRSQTDTEVLAHLIEERFDGDLVSAVRSALRDVTGSYALAVIARDAPDHIVAARQRSPLLLGVGLDAMLLASDPAPLLGFTRRVIYLEDGDVADVSGKKVWLYDARGVRKTPVVHELSWSETAIEKGGFEHYMRKEIHDIPTALSDAIVGRLHAHAPLDLGKETFPEQELLTASRLTVVACGTSHYAGLVGKSIIETIAGLPVDVHLASEFRYSPAPGCVGSPVILISQSGETADTLEAARRARALGCKTLAIVNVTGSTLARECDGLYELRAGPEVSVASTKAFVNTLAAFYVLAARIGVARGALDAGDGRALSKRLKDLPRLASRTILAEDDIQRAATSFFSPREVRSAFFLGRQVHHGIALEGALKLKEIAYVHAEGYAAGELKHGPLALLEPGLPVVAILHPEEASHEVMLSNVQEVRARGAKVLGLAPEGDATSLARHVDAIIRLPSTDALLYPVPAAVALHLLAYHAARARGCPIDRPRNLAKSVTVE